MVDQAAAAEVNQVQKVAFLLELELLVEIMAAQVITADNAERAAAAAQVQSVLLEHLVHQVQAARA
jgi:hypothetical protein